MKNCVSKNENVLSFIKKGISEVQKVQKNIYLSQIKRLIFTVAILLFSVLFINEAKAEEVKEFPKEALDSINVSLENADKEKLGISGDTNVSQVQVSVEYGEVSETGVKEVNGREKPTYTAYKDITFSLDDDYGCLGYITFRVSVYYYYADGDYVEIYYYAIQKLYEFLTLAGDKEQDGYVTQHGTFSRITIFYQVVYYTVSEYPYIAKIELDVDYWGEFSCNLDLYEKYS